MNDRLHKLSDQAGINMDAFQFSGTPIKYIVDESQLTKFAELIVGECCGAADEWYQKHNELHWDPAQHIRNHFGVE